MSSVLCVVLAGMAGGMCLEASGNVQRWKGAAQNTTLIAVFTAMSVERLVQIWQTSVFNAAVLNKIRIKN